MNIQPIFPAPFFCRCGTFRAVVMTLMVSGLCASSLLAEEPVYELSPFVVSTGDDRGYTASATLAGGRLASDLRDTAASISVFTPEFLADLGITTFLEAARWAPNSVPQEEIGGRNLYNDYAVNFRGLGLGFQARNYFRWYINSDAYSTARIEFARGPNSLVFGDAGVGGVANVSSKQALGSGRVEVEARASSYGGGRLTADVDMKLADNWFLRTAVLYQDFDDWRDVGGDKREGGFVTTTFRPTSSTSIRAEGEYGRLRRLITYNPIDQFTNWNGITTNPGFLGARDPVPPSLSRYNADRLIYNSARPDLGIVNLIGFAQTTGVFGQGILPEPQEGLPEFAVIPNHKFSLQAPNGGVENPYWTTSLFLEQRFGENTFLEIAGNYQYQERDITRWFFDQIHVDVNETLPGGQPSPYLGEIYGWARYWRNLQSNEVYDIRAALAHIIELDWTQQRLLVVGGHRSDRFEDHNHELVRTNGANPNMLAAANRIFAHRYLIDGRVPTLPPAAVDPVSGIESRVASTNGFFSEKPITYAQVAASGRWFSDHRLHTLVGVRRDEYKDRRNDGVQRDPVSSELLGFGPRVTQDRQSVTSKTVSGVYHIDRRWSLGAAYSESFDAGNAAVNLEGKSLKPLLSEGIELSLKFSLLENRLVGNLTYYRSEQENNRIGGEAAAINGIWELIGQADQQVTTGYQDRQTFAGRGWEFEITALPNDNWRFLFNLSLPETELKDGFDDTRAYLAENRALWETEANRFEAEGDTGRAGSIRSRITAIDERIESLERGRRLNNTFDYTANFFTRYYFVEGTLSGFSFGGGLNVRGKRLIGNEPGDPFAYRYARGYTLTSLLLAYEREVRGGDLTLQLNVSNLLDREIVRPADPPRGLGFTVQDPRQFLLTVRYGF